MPRLRLCYFAPELGEAAVVRRCAALVASGVAVQLFAFSRGRHRVSATECGWQEIHLGRTANRRYLQRLIAIFAALPKLLSFRAAFRDSDAFLARNLDMGLVAVCLRVLLCRRKYLVYELLDIPAIMFREDIAGRIARRLERIVLGEVDLVVVSSPGFVEGYLRPIQRYAGEWRLVENKLAYGKYVRPRRPKASNLACVEGWRIGWFGTLRDAWSFQALAELSRSTRVDVTVLLRGYPYLLGESVVAKLLDTSSRISFGGPYDAALDLQEMYRGVDLIWCLDLFRDHDNGRLLLPNRLYEAAYFGVPVLALTGTETGRRVAQDRLGWTIDKRSVSNIEDLLLELGSARYDHVAQGILGRNGQEFAGVDQVMGLVNTIASQLKSQIRS